MSDYCRAISLYSSPFGDYDSPSGEPSSKLIKMTPTLLSPLTPSFEFSNLHLNGDNSTGSTGSDDSDDEGLKEKSEQLSQLEKLFKQSLLRLNQTALPSTPTDDKLDLVSEDEKKRLRNTEAARRCREKIKRKTEDLEGELTSLTSHNDLLNQHRIRLLSQVEEQMRMLDMMKKRNPELGPTISFEAKKIVDTYTHQVEAKRRAIQDYYDKTCTKSY